MHYLVALVAAVFLSAAFCLGRADSQDPVKVDPGHFKVVFENEDIRVLEIRVQAGEKVPSHSHPPGFAYALSDFKAKTTFPDGTIIDGEYKTGQSAETKAVTHMEENTGKTEARLLLIEFKPK